MKKTVITLILAFAAALTLAAQEAPTAQDAAAEAAQAISAAPQEELPAPKPNYWTNSLVIDFGLNQTSLVDWAAGGYNTITLNSGLDAKADYAKDLASWNNRLQMQYGFLYSEEKEGLIQKNTDRLYLESKFAYKTGAESKWSYSAAFDFRTQFSDNFDTYVQDATTKKWSGTLKSGLLSPAYINLGLGMDWNPTSWFNLNVAPLTGSVVIVDIPLLRKNYGMELGVAEDDAEYTAAVAADDAAAIGSFYKGAKFQLGAQVKMGAKAKVNDNLGLETQLVVFSNYLKDPQNMRVNWDNKISWQLTKFFKFGLDTWLIYDPDVLIFSEKDNLTVQRVQFKEFVTFNFTWTFSNKK
ncbi:MAG: DUF3078 domain-containing protein [Bacteroidales bacterium]|nr:DUF3078 domain-containing protein [Bacteroidales bacterium]